MRLRNSVLVLIIGLLAVSGAAAVLIIFLGMDAIGDRDACNQAYERELARLKTWREGQLAKLVDLPEPKRLEAQLIIDYTMQIAAGKLQGSIMSRDDEECAKFRMRLWPEGIDGVGLYLNLDAIRFAVENLSWTNAAQADDAVLRIK